MARLYERNSAFVEGLNLLGRCQDSSVLLANMSHIIASQYISKTTAFCVTSSSTGESLDPEKTGKFRICYAEREVSWWRYVLTTEGVLGARSSDRLPALLGVPW